MRDGPLALLLLVAYGWLFVFSEGINNPNEMVRIYAARALLEEHDWSFAHRVASGGRLLDRGPIAESWGYVNDKALTCDDPAQKPPACSGRLYAAKAPAASVLAVPVLAALRLRGPLRKTEAVFALRWVWVILPTVAFWILLRRYLHSAGVAPDRALAVTLCAALGSLSLTYGQMFAGHQLAALALGAAFLCGFWGDSFGRGQQAATGFFAALSVALEYPSSPAAALLLGGVLLHRRRGLPWMIAGGLPWALLVAEFHWHAFGKPWSTPYSHLENPGFVRDIAPGFLGISAPTLERLYGSLFAPWLGLFYWAPWMALLLLGTRRKLPALTALAVCGYYLVFQVTHALWRSGWVIGPRYITPMVPFAAVAIAFALTDARMQWLCGAGAAAIAATGLASSVCQGFPLEVRNPLREVVWPLLSHGWTARNPLQLLGVPGLWSALPCFAALAIAIVVLLRRRRIALGLFVALTLAQWLAPASPERGAARFLASQWQPQPPPGATRF
jgi:hypothetical protein